MMLLMKEMFRIKDRLEWLTYERKIYDLFSSLSGVTVEMRNYGVQSGEISA